MRTKGIVDKCSDLTCTKKYASNEGPKRAVKLMWATRSAPPPKSFYACYGPVSGLQIITKYFSIPRAQISFPGDICIQFCLLYFVPFDGIFHVLIFQVPNIFA